MNKLTQISALSAAFLAAGKLSNAQIVYHDIDPDASWHGPDGVTGGLTVDIDFNSDGIREFAIHGFAKFVYTSSDFSPPIGNQYDETATIGVNQSIEMGETSKGAYFAGTNVVAFSMCSYNTKRYLVDVLNSGDAIGPLLTFVNNENGGGLLHGECHSGYWDNNYANGNWNDESLEDKYIGVRFKLGPNTHYGWVRLSTSYTPYTGTGTLDMGMIIKDFAYNATPGESIVAGEGGDACPAPIPITSIPAPTTAKLKWQVVEGADYYQVFYRPIGGGAWIKKLAASHIKKITDLTCDVDYEWKVRAKCGASVSEFSSVQTFTTTSCRLDAGDNMVDEIAIYPNPVTDHINVDLEEINEAVIIDIKDINGKLIYSEIVAKNGLIKIDLGGINAGIYFITIKGNNIFDTQKIIKQ